MTDQTHDTSIDHSDLEATYDHASPLYDWASDYLWCEEQAMRSLDQDDRDDHDADLIADRTLRAAEAEYDLDDDEGDDDPSPSDEDGR